MHEVHSEFLLNSQQIPLESQKRNKKHKNKSYLTFSSSDSSFNKYPEVSLNNLSFFLFFFQSAMGLCLFIESPPSITSM